MRAARIAAAALLAGVFSSCGVRVPDNSFAGSSTFGAVARLPRSWQTFDHTTVSDSAEFPDGVSVVGFAADGKPSTELFSATDVPGGWLLRRDLGSGEDYDRVIQDAVFPLDAGVEEGSLKVIEEPSLISKDGLKGVALAYRKATNAGVLVVRITGFATPDNTVYALAVGCSPACQETHREEIDQVLSGWKVVSQ